MNQLLTPEELATHYKISVKRIYALVRAGKLRAVRLPGSRLLRFDLDQLSPKGDDSKVLRFRKANKAA